MTGSRRPAHLPEQVVVFFRDNDPVPISHMSSGNDEAWCREVTIAGGEFGNEHSTEPLVRGECGISYTPPGVFTYDRQVEGQRESALGSLWNPMYFNYGIAIHGAREVPLEPASHGCIRLPMAIGERLQEVAAIGDQVFVFDGLREPEDVPNQDALPVFNWRDPDWTRPTTIPVSPPPPPPTEPPPTEPPPTEPPPTEPPPTEPQPTEPVPTTESGATTSPTTTPASPPDDPIRRTAVPRQPDPPPDGSG